MRTIILGILLSANVVAEPFAAPGDLRLRHDLQLLNDTGVTNIPLTSWPVSLGDVQQSLSAVDSTTLDAAVRPAFQRIRHRLARELDVATFNVQFGASGSNEPRVIRTFEHTPRSDLEAIAQLTWTGDRFSLNLSAAYVDAPFDGDEIRTDGTYVGVLLGNWLVSAGWQDHWFGPGRDGSLILANNARPSPGIMLQRNSSTPFKTRWLSWIGPWTLTTFMNQLDDAREVDSALLFGIRGSARPLTGLEIGISRTAQWCGSDRPCDLPTFADLLLGNDNRGVNVDPSSEPGNQLGGLDIRWALPKQVPMAVYMQWIGEDGRGGGGAIGSWLRQVGLEYWGEIHGLSHRTHFELSDTMCQEGGFGAAANKPNCAYEHSIYRSGYRYNGRSVGHAADGDTKSYSIGSTLVQTAGHSWNVSLRYMEINRQGAANSRHTLSPRPQELLDVQVSHERETQFGRFHVGIAYAQTDDTTTSTTNSEISGFIRWVSHRRPTR